MKVFTLSDLHLSLAPGELEAAACYKPMDIFGSAWTDHHKRIEQAWQQLVKPEDAVLVPGDISWAMHLPDAAADFAFLGSLPGTIVISKGNHDYWWQSISRLRDALPYNCRALQHDAIAIGGRAVCATRGWLLPEHNEFKEKDDRKIYDREVLRLEMALQDAARLDLPPVVMLHYPPLIKEGVSNAMIELLQRYGVKLCIYGHLHGSALKNAVEGEHFGIEFVNASCDHLKFTPRLLWEYQQE